MIKRTIHRIFSSLGYTLVKKETQQPKNMFTLDRALGRAAMRQPGIRTVIDVGASDGRWSENCLKFFPDANYLLVEAQSAHKDGLKKFKSQHPNGDYVIAVAGETDGEVFFDDSQLFGGQASTSSTGENMKVLPQVSLDNEIERRDLKGPFLLKLDTHGFEVPILDGAKQLLKNTNLLIIETYNFRLTDSSLRYWELCSYLDSLGFASVDQADLMLRKKDRSFWQMDTFFIRKDHEIFSSNTYD